MVSVVFVFVIGVFLAGFGCVGLFGLFDDIGGF